MRTSLVLFIVLFAAQCLNAQSYNTKHYLFPDFTRGVVYYKEGAAVRHEMNYNLMTDEMYYINDKDKKLALYDFDKIEYISIGLHRFIPLDADFAEVVMETDEVALTVKRSTNVSGSSRGKVNKSLNRFEKLADNIILKPDSSYYLVRLVKPQGIKKGIFKGLALSQNKVVDATQSGFFKIYSDYKPQIEEFIKNEDIDFKNAENIIRLMNFCDNLKSETLVSY